MESNIARSIGIELKFGGDGEACSTCGNGEACGTSGDAARDTIL